MEIFDTGGLSRRQDVLEETLPVVVVLCLLLATLLRIFHLGTQSLWVDELLTIEQGRAVGHSLLEQFFDDFQTPLPMVIVSGLSSLSMAEAWLRLPGAILGILSIPLMLDVSRHFVGRRAAVLAMLLLAVHPLHVAHSQELRGYAYLIFFGLATASVALRDPRPWSVGRWCAVVALGVATTLSNLQGLFWMSGLACMIWWGGISRPENRLRHLSAFVAIAALTSPWWLRSFGVIEMGRVLPGEALGEPLRGASTFSWWSLPYAGFVLSFGKSLGPTTAQLHDAFAPGVQPLAAIAAWPTWLFIAAALSAGLTLTLAGVGLRRLGRRSVALLWWVLPVVLIAVALSARNVKPFNPRYVIAVLPALLVVVAAGMDSLGRRGGLVAIVAWLVLTGVSLNNHYFDPGHQHADVRAAARLVQDRGGGDDAILVPTVDRVFLHYYRGSSPVESAYEKDFVSEQSMAERAAAVAPQQRYLWYVEARRWFSDPEGRFPMVLAEHYRQLSEFRVSGVRILLYDRQAMPLDRER